MIPSRHTKNVSFTAPILNMLVDGPYMEKALIRTVYQQWQGENINQIREKHQDNPYTLRIGTPNTDKALQSDAVFFIQSYLSYNPITKNIEKRELIPYRNVDRVYIGEQRVDENLFKDSTLMVNGNIVAQDYALLDSNKTVLQQISELRQEIDSLRNELTKLRSQTKQQPIYTQ